jgi:hypothetical protein
VTQIEKMGFISIPKGDNTYSSLNSALNFLYILVMIFGSIIVLYTRLSSVNGRTREIGVLKAVGWDNKRVTIMIISVAMIMAIRLIMNVTLKRIKFLLHILEVTGSILGPISGFLE